jgi:hypothetical protein
LTRPRTRATVIIHVSGANAPKSLAALEEIVLQPRAQGYQFAIWYRHLPWALGHGPIALRGGA